VATPLTVMAVGKQGRQTKNSAKAVALPTVMASVGKKGKQQKKIAQVATPPTVMAVGKQGRQTKNSAKAVAPPTVIASVGKKGKQQKKGAQVATPPTVMAVGKQRRQTKNAAKAVAPPFVAGVAKKGKQQRKPGSTKAKSSGATAKLEQLPNKKESQADQSAAEGTNLAMFLAKYCIFLSEKKPMYEFPVIPEGKKTIRLCLPTTVRIFGLPTSTFQIVQALHTKDKKKIGLSMLKYFTEKFTGKPKMLAFYQTFRRWFPQEVVPVTPSFSQAVNLIEKALLGKIMLLDENAQAAVKYIFSNHLPRLKDLKAVSNGGENIAFAPPKGMKDWDGLVKPKVIALESALKKVVKELWKKNPKACEHFRYKTSCLFSRLSSENPTGIPQTAHTDFEADAVDMTMTNLKVSPLIAFTPMWEDGCMLLIWTKEYRRWQNLSHDKPAKYYLYIPFGTLLVLPGKVMHSGGFCFGHIFQSDTNDNSSIWRFSNHRLHFFLCPDQISYDQADSDHNEIYYDDDNNEVAMSNTDDNQSGLKRKRDHPDYIVVDNNFAKLQNNLLSKLEEEDDCDTDAEKKIAPQQKKKKSKETLKK